PVSKRPILADLKRWAQISILEILNVFLWLKFSPALSLTKLKRFESGSVQYRYYQREFSFSYKVPP
ncbi:MAG: hypothetical protein KKC46_07675, partial [Proteobacteria bacterium]|nr:hypothetical protein [Pseudomonadota bacterium]